MGNMEIHHNKLFNLENKNSTKTGASGRLAFYVEVKAVVGDVTMTLRGGTAIKLTFFAFFGVLMNVYMHGFVSWIDTLNPFLFITLFMG